VYYLPDLKGQNEVVQSIAGGWELSAITQYASGTSTTFSQNGLSEDTNLTVGNKSNGLASLFGVGYTNVQRPLSTGQSCSAGTHGAQVLNPGAATLVGYEIGTIPNNIMMIGACPGPGYVNTDFSVDKNCGVSGCAYNSASTSSTCGTIRTSTVVAASTEPRAAPLPTR